MSGSSDGATPAAPASPDLTSLAFETLNERLPVRLRRAMGVLAVAQLGLRSARAVEARARERFAFSVSVSADDELYRLVRRWLTDQIPERRLRSMRAETRRVAGDDSPAEADSSARRTRPLVLFHDGRAAETVTIGSHRVRVTVESETPSIESLLAEGRSRGGSSGLRTERVVFTAMSPAGRNAVVGLLRDLAANLDDSKRPPRIYLANRWGSWERRDDLPLRSFESVILRAGQAESLIADLDGFYSDEEWYGHLGLPWHRCYLFHGPPGTGKTSIAKALAERFRLDVYFIALGDLSGDTSLLQLVSAVPARSMLLLEDVDTLHAAVDREATPDTPSMSALLNALDGIVTPHGLVTVMTTNRIEALDEALVRPGRADRVERIDTLDAEQLDRLLAMVYPRHAPRRPRAFPPDLTAAQVVEWAKRHPTEPVHVARLIEASAR